MEIHTVVEEKITNDVDFQVSLESMSDEDKNQAISQKRTELINQEFEALNKAKENENKKFNDQKIRAEQAEAELKKTKAAGEGLTPKNETGLTAEDVLDLTSSGVSHREDIDLARTWAKNSGKSLKDILEDKTFKTVLETQQEERKTASTTQIKGGARGVNKTSGDDLLKRKNEKGEFPESDEDIDKMLDADFEARKKALKRN